MLTLEWVEEQIKEALEGGNTPQNVRDFALLCIARDNLRVATASRAPLTVEVESPVQMVSERGELEPVNDSDLFSRELSVEEMEKLMRRMRVGSKKDYEKARDLRTYLNIVKEAQK